MQYKYGFTGGMNKDIAPNKRNPDTYYDATNIRVISNDTGTAGSAVPEPGNIPLIKLPSSLKKVYSIIVDVNGTGDTLSITPISGTTRTIDLSPYTSVEGIYNAIVSDTGISYDISVKRYKIVYKYNTIAIVGISDLYSVSSTENGQLSVSLRVDAITEDLGIVGLGTVRDYLIVFSAGSNVEGNGQIWVCKYDSYTDTIEDANIVGGISYLDVDKHLLYNGILNFSSYSIGEVISKYQDSENLKIYFIDGNITLKHINILDPNVMALDESSLEIIPKAALTQPKPVSVSKGGLYKAGMVQYAYQLYNLNGAESNFSPTSGLVHLTSSNESYSNSGVYKGNDIEEDTGKTVKLLIENADLSFEYIRIVSLFYSTKEGQPTISIIYEGRNSGTININDSGDTILGVYTNAEFNGYGNTLIKPKTITTKNNYLIAANITEEYFDFDEVMNWDARAYRNNGKLYFKIDGDTYHTDAYANVPVDANCILTESDYATYKFNDAQELGGSGVNVNYRFKIITIPIDNINSSTSLMVDAASQSWSSDLDNTFSDNNSYGNYTSPINHAQLMGYPRGETYRFGVVISDSLGRQSFVKWIADIRFPDQYEEDDFITTYYADTVTKAIAKHDYKTFFACQDGTGIYANILGIEFTVNNLPAGYTYRIVRVRREEKDKSIVAQGLVGFTNYYDAGDGALLYPTPYISRTGLSEDILNARDDSVEDLISNGYGYALTFKSPEVAFNLLDKAYEGDLIEFVSRIPNNSSTHITTSVTSKIDYWYDKVIVQKIIDSETIADNISVGVKDSIKTFSDATATNPAQYNIDNDGANTVYRNYMQIRDRHSSLQANALRGNNLLIGTSDNLITVLAAIEGLVIANIKRDTSTIRYGGVTYYDRLNNYYINAGNTMNSTDTKSYVFGGDVFITYFDYINQMVREFDHTVDPGDEEDETRRTFWERTNIVYVPLESTVCTELKHGSSYSRDAKTYKIQETVEEGNYIHPDGTARGAYSASYKDVYLYNTVYSSEPTSKTYTPKPLYFNNTITNDCMFIASQKHVEGQITDSWTKFLPDTTTIVNGTFGSVNKILVYNNLLLFLQDKSCGIMSFNDRQLLTAQDSTQLVLGSGDIFDTYRYISETYGTKNKFSVIDTEDSVYFFDATSKKILRIFNGNVEALSDIKGLSGYLKDKDYDTSYDKPLSGIGTHGVYDSSVNRVIYTMQSQDHTKDFTIGFNRNLNAFESFYSYIPNIYLSINGKMLSCGGDDNTYIYLHTHNQEDKLRCEFYGTTYNSDISIIASQQPDVKKVFTNIELNGNLTDNYGTALESYDDFVPDSGKVSLYASHLKFWNTWQNTDDILLNSSNIKRRFRTWYYQIPKISGMRMMDYWVGIKFTHYTPSVLPEELGNPKTFKLDDITVSHLIPIL